MPAVLLVHAPFRDLAHAQCQALGATHPTLVVYPQDVPARETEDAIIAKARHVAAEVVTLLSSTP
jgi:hypothetical protein